MNQLTSCMVFFLLLFVGVSSVSDTHACTGISLKSQDGAVVVSRTVEWALSNAQHNKLMLVPRSKKFTARTPQGLNGKQWQSKFGFISMTAYGQPFGPDGLNEKGLYVGMYYLPGYASYYPYEAKHAAKSMSVGDFMQWMLSSFQTVDEVRKNLNAVRVVNVEDPSFGGAPLPFHWKVADPSGASLIIELVDGGQVKVYDSVLGVITNAPTYDWHITNLRNYIKLSPEAAKTISLDRIELSPLGAGSGMIGLPGDFSPPSRFIRAAALTATARPLATGLDAVFESFRILDSFNIPLGAIANRDQIATDIESATQITSASDLKNLRYYFHTMNDRQVRMVDLKEIDFKKVKEQMIVDELEQNNSFRKLSIN